MVLIEVTGSTPDPPSKKIKNLVALEGSSG
jgi:hypothetical protein